MSVQSTRRSNPVHGISCGRAQRERVLGQAGSPDPVPSALVAVIAAQIAEHCGHRLLKCRRLAAGWTVAQAVEATHDFVEQEGLTKVGLTVRSWKDWEAGQLPNSDYQDLLCRLFTTNPVELGFACDYSPAPPQHNSPHWNAVQGDITPPEGGADHAGMGPRTMEVEETKRRDALKFAGLALTAPAAAAQILQQAAAEAMEFTRQAEAGALGSGTLDHLDLAVTEFNHAYSLKPPQQVFFGAVLDYRRKVDGLLKGKHTHPQGRELLAFAGWLSELLAGSPTTWAMPTPASLSRTTRSSMPSRPDMASCARGRWTRPPPSTCTNNGPAKPWRPPARAWPKPPPTIR